MHLHTFIVFHITAFYLKHFLEVSSVWSDYICGNFFIYRNVTLSLHCPSNTENPNQFMCSRSVTPHLYLSHSKYTYEYSIYTRLIVLTSTKRIYPFFFTIFFDVLHLCKYATVRWSKLLVATQFTSNLYRIHIVQYLKCITFV